MTKTVLLLMMAIAVPVSAAAGQSAAPKPTPPGTTAPSTATSTAGTAQQAPAAGSAEARADGTRPDETLPVSIDRIRKALAVETPADAPLAKPIDTNEDGVPRFSVRTEAPRTLKLSSYLDDGTAVPSYVRPSVDMYHYEFLEMTTPDDYKGCAQFGESQCVTAMSQRVVSGLVWQQMLAPHVDKAIRRIFTP
jgi:hypothetical protein